MTDALREAQEKGYAEADPTLDVSGWDAAHKAIILASLSYGFWIPQDKVHVEGVERVSITDFKFAARLGYTIKLLSVIRADENGLVEVRTQPTLVPLSHVLAKCERCVQCGAGEWRRRGRDAVSMDAGAGTGSDQQQRDQRPLRSRRRADAWGASQRLRAAWSLRQIEAGR
jgi:homoserine dehydrogenase